jgi:uncharacterized protein YecE (DUF72 family)
MPVYVGTSGWQYRDWRGVLYPPGVAQGSWLEYYAGHFGTVENNGSFYRLPSRETFASWRDRTPDGFVMAVKASRYLTHIKRLRDPAEPVERLLRAATALGDRLGPVLVQLPPNLRADAAALDDCLREFSRFGADADLRPAGTGELPARSDTAGRIRVAVELRHSSWWTEEVRQLLARHDAALCWADRRGRPVTPLWRTADWGYLRFHESAARPWPRYGERALRSWVRRAADAWPDDADVFVYFNNDQHGAAVQDAAAYASITGRAGHLVARLPGSSVFVPAPVASIGKAPGPAPR